ncbi:MAG TPA: DUF4760 domain-containing protein [Candidatus Rubrimentiphilum sp.]|nr:DUF4760 domain-containing protein [Candidatus Rubrimentiphilum sp.]
MTWEAVTAVATAFTGLVIAATVVVGARQLRLTRDTLDELRRATQLEGTMRVLDDIMGPDFRAAMLFVANELPLKMQDESFRATVSRMGAEDSATHKELTVLRTLERVGSYIKYGLLDGDVIYDVSIPVFISAWESLQPVIAIHRRERGEGFWENFEYLYRAAIRWRERSRSDESYLKNLKF